MIRRTLLLVALAVVATTGCGKAASRAAAPAATSTVAAAPTSTTGPEATAPATTAAPDAPHPTTSVPPVPAPPPTTGGPRPASVGLSEAANATTVTARIGATVTVVLHSTYWSFDVPSGPVLVATGPPTPAPGQGCGATVPGSGCGTVTLVVRAAAVGSASLTAQRASCGEALRCTPDQGTWAVTVRVTP